MNIEHFAMYVLNLEDTKDFFVKHFGAKPNELYHNPRSDFKSYFLSFECGAKLEIMTRPNLVTQPKNPMQCGYIHIAMSVGSKDAVNKLTEQIREDGYAVISEPRTTGDGCYESCILGPENNIIEITI